MSIFTSDKIKEHIKKQDEEKIVHQNLYEKDITGFMKNLANNKFSQNELNQILNKNPGLSLQTFQGLHTLHYAILSNESSHINSVMRTAMNNGMTEFPNTGITSDSKYDNNQPILKFSYKQNKLDSFITLFRFANFHEKDVRDIALLSMVELNSDFNSFFKSVYGSKNMNELNHSLFSQKKYARLIATSLVKTKGNIKSLKKFGYDFFKESENGTLLHSLFSDSSIYYLEDELKKTIVSIDNQHKHSTISSYFLESILHSKDLNINAKDEVGVPLYKLITEYMKHTHIEYGFKEKLNIKIEELILQNLIPENKPSEIHQRKNIKF